MKKEKEHIRKTLILMMVFIYTFGLIKPTLPILKDFLAHTFFKTSHTVIHLENGKYHLHYELMEEAQKSGSQPTMLLTNAEPLFSHLKNDDFLFRFYTKTIREINSIHFNALTDVIIPHLLPPPKV